MFSLPSKPRLISLLIQGLICRKKVVEHEVQELDAENTEFWNEKNATKTSSWGH